MGDIVFDLLLLAAGWALGAAWWHHRTQTVLAAAWDALADGWEDLAVERRDLDRRYAAGRLADSLANGGDDAA